MTSRTRLFVALSAVALVGLTACSGPAAGPEPDAPETPAPTTPAGTGDFIPDDAWFTGFDEARAGLADYVGWWDMQECTYDTVIEGDFNCSIHIAGIQEQVLAVDSYLADVVNIAPGSEEQVDGLQDAAATSAEAAAAATAFSDSGCDFSPGESCAEGADEMVRLAADLDAALAGWERPAG